MPEIGVPQDIKSKNPFKNVGMGPKSAPKNKGDAPAEKIGDFANQLVGYEQKNERAQVVEQGKHNKMGKDEFLKLLSHQMQHQDPFNPMDQNKFAADLAQFSQLEQLANMNTTMSNLDKNGPTESKFLAASFLGKNVTTSGSSIKIDGEHKNGDIMFRLDKPAKNLTVRIYDEKNQMVRQLDENDIGKGTQSVFWDGEGADGMPATKGIYRVEVLAYGKDLSQIRAHTQETGQVTNVHFENGEMILTVDGQKKVFLRDVEHFSLGDEKKEEAVKPKKNAKEVTSNYKDLVNYDK